MERRFEHTTIETKKPHNVFKKSKHSRVRNIAHISTLRRTLIYKKGLTSYSGTTFRVIIRYWHDLFSRSNSGTTFFDGSDTGTTSAFPMRWHFLFFPPPPGCHMFLLFSLSPPSLFARRPQRRNSTAFLYRRLGASGERKSDT